MIINENKMLQMFVTAQNVLLIEPPYKRSWMPQGLAKISTYCKEHGANVSFHRAVPVLPDTDLIVVTTLFTYDFPEIQKTLLSVQMMYPTTPVIVGGVMATMDALKILTWFPNVLVYKGVSKTLDVRVPDYNLDWQMDEKYWDCSWVFTQRGCVNKCAYCAVPKLEPEMWVNPNWKNHILPDKKDVILCDNNISAGSMKHQIEVFEYLIDQGKQVDVNAGIDCKHVTPELATILGKITFIGAGLKLAFDRIGEDGVFQEAVELLVEKGVMRSAIQAYVLFNFNDTPQEANYRASECRRLKITPYPQMYAPLNKWERTSSHIGKHWTLNLAHAFRYYWLLRGHYNHMSFDDFLRGNHSKEKSKGRVPIDNYDLSVWEKHKEVKYV